MYRCAKFLRPSMEEEKAAKEREGKKEERSVFLSLSFDHVADSGVIRLTVSQKNRIRILSDHNYPDNYPNLSG